MPQASVTALPTNKDAARGGGQGRSAADERFLFDAEPGEYTLSARADGYGATTLAVTIGAAGLSDARLEPEKGLEIKGRVLDASGQGFPA